MCSFVTIHLFWSASCCCAKTDDQNHLDGGKDLFLLYMEEKQNRSSNRDVEAGTEAEPLKEWCSLACVLTHAEPAFLIQPRISCLGMVPPTVDLAFVRQLAVKMSPRRAPNYSDRKRSLS